MEPMIPVENHADLEPHAFARISEVTRSHRSLKIAIDWWVNQVPPLAPTGMVTQDEYSHDILVAYPGNLWLAYDST